MLVDARNGRPLFAPFRCMEAEDMNGGACAADRGGPLLETDDTLQRHVKKWPEGIRGTNTDLLTGLCSSTNKDFLWVKL